MVETFYGDDCGSIDSTLIANFGNDTETKASFAGKLLNRLVQPLDALKEPICDHHFLEGVIQVQSDNFHFWILDDDRDIPSLGFVPSERQ